MKKFQLRHLLIYLHGLVIFEFFSVFPNMIFAKDIVKNNFKGTNLNSPLFKLKQFEKTNKFSNSVFSAKYEFLEDLKANGEKLFTLLAFEQKELEDKFFAEIDSDVQFREEGIFYAEGNAVIYLSNATLEGDSIQYDLENKLLTVIGNVVFKKGDQYFEASKLFYDLRNDTGFIDDVYGLLDSKTFNDDFKLELFEKDRDIIEDPNNEIRKPKYLNTATIGLVNQFEENKSLNIKKANIEIPSISRWRYQTEKLTYNSKSLESKKIFFTNDIYNKPQFIFLSKNFSAEIIKNKLRLLSRNSWIILDDKLKVPIGRRSVFDKDPLTKWGIGADFKDKDGYYLFRSIYPRKFFRNFSFQLQPYFLAQRALKGESKSFRAKNASIFTEKVKDDVKFTDYFALDINLQGKEKEWDIDSKIQLNSLNYERLNESLRTKFTLSKSINLNKKTDSNESIEKGEESSDFLGFEEYKNNTLFNEDINTKSINISSVENDQIFNNFIDLKIYNVFRERVINDFSNEEIYFASGFNISNNKKWNLNNKQSKLSLIYDFGHFKAKSLTEDKFNDLLRNLFVAKYNYQFPIWKKTNLDLNIDQSYKYSPVVIEQSLNWFTGLQTGFFLYSDGTSQIATKFNSGPVLTIGSFKKKFFDYTYLGANFNYVVKEGDSPYSFDNVTKDPKINFNFEQQIYGPLLFSYQNSLNLDSGDFSNPNYALDFKRRAYSVGAFYNTRDESLGIRFNIFNFDYSGISSKFRDEI